MRKLAGHRLFGLLALLIAFSSQAAHADVGRIEAGEGNIEIISSTGVSRTGTVGEGLAPGDIVSTAGEESWAILRMEDGASFTLRPDTRLEIDKYQYQEAQPSQDQSWLKLLRGSLRAITGLIGKENPRSYALNTPTATIGIRGTDHETTVIDEAHATKSVPAGTYDSVNAGETVMRDAQGEIDIKPGKVGFLERIGGRPRVLAHRPAFFRRLRRFDTRHGIIDVLTHIHQRLRNGGFTAPADLRERLKREMHSRPLWRAHPRAAGNRQRIRRAGASAHWRQRLARRQAQAQAHRKQGARSARNEGRHHEGRRRANAKRPNKAERKQRKSKKSTEPRHRRSRQHKR